MYRLSAVLLVVALAKSIAVAAIVQFAPEVAEVPITPATYPTFEVTVIPEVEGGFDTIDLVIGSDDGLEIVDFAFSDDWHAAFTTTSPLFPVGVYASDLFLSAGSPTLVDVPSLYAGTLTVRASVYGLGPGDYALGVDTAIDGFSNLGQQGVPEPVYGSAIVRIIPEPATLGLLAMASLAILGRPRTGRGSTGE